MVRQVAPEINENGLLVGWSLEHMQRKSVYGFIDHEPLTTSGTLKYLEPIIYDGGGHLMTVAPTGAGKGTGSIIPALLRHKGPAIVVDPKGENYAVTARRRKELGQEVVLLDPFGVTGAEGASAFNPFDLLENNTSSRLDDAATLAAMLAPDQGGAGRNNRFWENMAQQLIQALVLYVLKVKLKKDHHFGTVAALLNSSVDEFKAMADTLKKFNDRELDTITGVLSSPAPETMGGYIAYALEKLDFIRSQEVVQSIGKSSFDVNAIVRGDPITVYLVLPPEKLESHAGLLRLWIGSFVALLTRRRHKVDTKTLFIVDEAAQLGPMPLLKQAITLLRGYGVQVWSFWQDIGQLKQLYPEDWATIVNNCAIHQFMGARTWMAAEEVRKIVGIFDANEILRLQYQEMLLSIAGDETVVARQPSYLTDPVFRNQFDANPFYATHSETAPLAEPVEEQRVYVRKSPSEETNSTARKFKSKWTNASTARAKHYLRHQTPDVNAWKALELEEEQRLSEEIGKILKGMNENAEKLTFRKWKLPFYENATLFYVETFGKPKRFSFFVEHEKDKYMLNGQGGLIHHMNEVLGVNVTLENVLDYLFFFSSNIRGEDGPFFIIDELKDIQWTEEPETDIFRFLEDQIQPPEILPSDENDNQFIIRANVIYGTTFYRTTFGVTTGGEVEMIEDEPLCANLAINDGRSYMKKYLALTTLFHSD